MKCEADMQHRASFGIPQNRGYGMTDTELALLDLKVSKVCHALFVFSSCAVDIHTNEPPMEKNPSFIFSSIFSATGPNVIFV